MIRTLLLLLLLSNGSIAQEACEGCGFYAVNIQNAEVRTLGDYDHAFIPASTWKVVTAFSALAVLGESAHFESTLFIDGEIDQFGVLWGDVVLKPDRDPTWYSHHLTSEKKEVFYELTSAIRSSGIRCISGSVIVDLSSLGTDVLAPTWPWEDLGNYYATGAWGVNYLDNTLKLRFVRGERGPVLRSVDPVVPSVTWVNELEYGKVGTGDQAYIHAAPQQRIRYIRGTLPVDMTEMIIKGAMPDPTEIFLNEWGKVLKEEGVEFEKMRVNREPGLSSKKRRAVHDVRSPISIVVKTALKESDNLYTEALLRKAFPGRSYKTSLASFESFLRDKGWSVSPKDGAGLSTALRWSPEEAGGMLNAFLSDHPSFSDYLPMISETSLGRYAPEARQTRLKSGSMTDVTTYLGVWEGEWVFFVGHNGRRPKRDKVRRQMVDWLRSLPLSRK